MHGNFDEFLSANRLRKYPFEDSATLAGSGGVYLPKEWLVDCKVVIQRPMSGLVYLQSVDFSTSTVVFADSVTLDPLARGRLDCLPGNEPHVYLKTPDGTAPAGVMTLGTPGGCEHVNGTLAAVAFAQGRVTFEPEATTLVPSASCVIESAGVRGVRLADGTVHGLGQRSLSLVPDGVFDFTDEQFDFIGLHLYGASYSNNTLLERCNPPDQDPPYRFTRRRIQRVVFKHTGSGAVTPFRAVRVALNDTPTDGLVALVDRNDLMAGMSACPSDGLPDTDGNLPDTRDCNESDPEPVELAYGPEPAAITVPVKNGEVRILPAETIRRFVRIAPPPYWDLGPGMRAGRPGYPGGNRLEIGPPATPSPTTTAVRPVR